MREIIANLFGATVTVLMFAIAPCIGAPLNFITAAERSLFVQPMCTDWPSMQVVQSRFPGCCDVGNFECRFRNGSHEGCIPLYQFHDGQLHCEDGSDEACFPEQIRCGNFCADLIHLAECIRYPHCPNGANATSEFTPLSPIVPSPVIGVESPTFCKFLNHTLCGSFAAISCRGYGDCVYGASFMDGKRDCFDGSDEDPQYVSLFKSVGTKPVFPIQLPSPLTAPTTPVIPAFATVVLPTFAPPTVPANGNPTLSQALVIGPPNDEHAIHLIIPIPHVDSPEKGKTDRIRPPGLGHNNLTPLVESEIPLPPKKPFGLPKTHSSESFGVNQSSLASVGLSIGIGVGQLTVPKPEIIWPENEHWNMKYVPLPSSQPNSSRFYSRKPIETTSFLFLAPASDKSALDDFGMTSTLSPLFLISAKPAIESTTVGAAVHTAESTVRETTQRRQLDLGRYYLWPNQDGWVIFPPNRNDNVAQGPFHERLPAQPGGVFVVKPAKVAPITDRRVTPIAGSNRLLWPSAVKSTTDELPTVLNGQTGKNRQLDSIYLLEPDHVLTTTRASVHQHTTIALPPVWTIKETESISSTPEPSIMTTENKYIAPVVPVFVSPIRSGVLTAERVIGGEMLPLPLLHRADWSPPTSTPCLSTDAAVGGESDWPLSPLAPIVPVNVPLSEGDRQKPETQATSTTITFDTTVIITEIETTTIHATTTRSTISEAKGVFDLTSTTKPDDFVDLLTMEKCTETTMNETETMTTRPGQGTVVLAVKSDNSTIPEAEAEGTETIPTATLTTQQIGSNGSHGTEIMRSTTFGEQRHFSTDQMPASEQLPTKMSSINYQGGFIVTLVPAIIRPIPELDGRSSDLGLIVAETSTRFISDSNWTLNETSTTGEYNNVTTILQQHTSTQADSETMGNETVTQRLQDPKQAEHQSRRPVDIVSLAVNRTNFVENTTVINANVSAVTVSTVSPYKPLTSQLLDVSMSSKSVTVTWARTGVEAAAIRQNEKELSAMNCTQRVRELSRRFAPSPICDCPSGQMRDVHSICRRTDVATFRARLTRFCGARAHLDSLTGDAQAAIVFAKLAATLPNISICIRHSAGALVIVNAQCGTSCTFDELQQEYYSAHNLMSEIDLKIAELEESACYQPSLNDCDGSVADCVPLGLHYVCECRPGVTANATRSGADGAPRCRDDHSWRNTCTRLLDICLLYWLMGTLLLCALAALVLCLWVHLFESDAAALNDGREKYYEEKRIPRLPTGEYSAYTAIYRIMRLVSNLIDEEQLATRRVLSRASPSTVDQTIDETEEKEKEKNDRNDENGEDIGKWLERPSDERSTPPPSNRNSQMATANLVRDPVTVVRADEKLSVFLENHQRELQKEEFVTKNRKDSLASEGSTTETLWENYKHHPPMTLRTNGRQESEDSINYFIRQREDQLRRARQARQSVLPNTETTTPYSTAIVLAEAARKGEAEIKREVKGGVPPHAGEKPVHFCQLPAVAPNIPPPSQAEPVTFIFRAKQRGRDASQCSAASAAASRPERAESRRSSMRLARSCMSDEIETKPARYFSHQFSDGAPPRQRRLSRATLELAEHRALRRQVIYDVQPSSLPSKFLSTTVQPIDLESPIRSVGSLPPIHPSRRPPIAERPPPLETQKPRLGKTLKSEKSVHSSAREPVKAAYRSLGNRRLSSLASSKRIQTRSVPETSKSLNRRPRLNSQFKNESALTDLAQLSISLSYPSIRERYTARQGGPPDEVLLLEDMDLDLPEPCVRPAKTSGIERTNSRKKTRNSGKSGSSSRSSSTIARKIASRQAAAPSERKPTRADVYNDSPSACERFERLRAQFDERVHSGCLKNQLPWDGSPARSRDSPASSGGLGGASLLSMTGLQMRRTRSSGDFLTRNGGPHRTFGNRQPIAQRRVVTFNETSIELGERSRSMMDVPRARSGDKPLPLDVAKPARRLPHTERDQTNTKSDAICRTNKFRVDDGQRDQWLQRFQGTIDSKSWLDYD